MNTAQKSTEGQKKVTSSIIRLLRTTSVPVMAVLLAALIGAVILLVSGANPFASYAALLKGAFGNMTALGRTLEKATPLIFSGIAVAFAFKAGLFNIGAQGQLLFGSITAAAIGFGIDGLPALIHIPLALLGGGLAGALFAGISASLPRQIFPPPTTMATSTPPFTTCIICSEIPLNTRVSIP